MKIVFECRAMPSLAIATNGRVYKFRGGRLEVEPSEAADVREYAARMPHFKITEVEQPKPFNSEAVAAKMSMTKDELVALAEQTGMPHDEAASLTKPELVDALTKGGTDDG